MPDPTTEDRLERMFAMQLALQHVVATRPGGGPAPQFPTGAYSLGEEDLVRLEAGVQFNCRALFHEVAELEDWTRWKAWSAQLGNKQEIELGGPEHLKEMRLEAVDLMHFLLNVFMWLGMDADDVFAVYTAKCRVNHDRQATKGY